MAAPHPVSLSLASGRELEGPLGNRCSDEGSESFCQEVNTKHKAID